MTTTFGAESQRGAFTLTLSAEDRVRVERVEALARRGSESAAELIALLDEPSWAVRRAVIAALASIGEAAVPGLLSVLQGARENEGRIAAAVDALVATGADVEQRLVTLARSDRSPVACDAVQVLGRRRAHKTVGLLSELSRHTDDNVAVAAIEALGRIGGTATVDALVAAVEARHFFRTFPAIDALGRTGDTRAVAPLTALLEDPLYAPEAARALGRTGQESAVAPLAKILARSTDALVRTAALALAELRERYETRIGETEAISKALENAVSTADASARLVAALPGMAPSELAATARVLAWLGDPVAIEQLVEMTMAEPPVGPASADSLRRLGRRATPYLLLAIRTGDSERRLRLLPIVGYAPGSVDDLLICLGDPSADVRVRACQALARLGDTGAVSALFRLLGDRDHRVSQAAAAAVQSLGSLETRRLSLEQARSPDKRTRRAALRIISYFGYPEGLDVLIEAMNDEDEKIREAGIYGLPLIDDPKGIAALLSTSKHPVPKTRAAVMRALGQTQAAPSIIATLEQGLADEDAWVRYYACQALGRLRVDSACSRIVALMEDGSGQVRVGAVEALAHLGDPDAAKALLVAASSSDPDMRRAALLGLGIARRPEAIPILRQAAGSDDAATRLVAIGALAEFEAPDVVPTLGHAASDPDDSVRAAAIGFLSTRPGADSTAALIERLIDGAVRDRVIEALAVAADERVDGVLAALEQADADRAPLLVAALVRMRRPSSQAAIASALAFENVHARRAAASALAALGTPEARDAAQRATSDPDPDVRRICVTFVQRTS